ncbi:hypothetical protein EI94DRAFT_1731000 [Lactarius quietus]|nr:hypothetical protein EI94DRAFT_1731000 [Lactarius quietus]
MCFDVQGAIAAGTTLSATYGCLRCSACDGVERKGSCHILRKESYMIYLRRSSLESPEKIR